MTSEQDQSAVATTAKHRRRWFQFSLTSLFVLTTLFALWLAWELSCIRARRAWIVENAALINLDSKPSQVMNITVQGDLLRLQRR